MKDGKTKARKHEHIRICLEEEVESHTGSGFKDIILIHESLPDLNLNEVDASYEFLGRKVGAPLVIEPITGGVEDALEINRRLAEAADEHGIILSLGSQRAALEDPGLEETYRVARDAAPTAVILANIGCAQLLQGDPVEAAEKAVDMIEADGLTVHLNPLQEAVQPEGETSMQGIYAKLGRLTQELKVPLIVKETGAGISAETAMRLERQGVRFVDVSGVGGTSWAGVEYYRALSMGDPLRARLGEAFWDWGIPTAVSLLEVLEFTSMRAIASGGLRSGLDLAKAVALGAEAGGAALPFLKAAVKSREAVSSLIEGIIRELKLAMFLTGSRNIKELKSKPLIILGRTGEWLSLRGV
ncbi:MAG: type 2 isopentenyl-diphosphate Delta-isomerase, partial [Candidatus Bathyarchaeia archaeon]